MVLKQLESKDKKTFSISYLDKKEAMFVLGVLRHTSCSNCVDFYQGCKGGPSLQENASIDDQEYLVRHTQGTESFLCGKLRNIISLSKAEEQDLQNQFEVDFNKRISLISKKGDSEHYVLISDREELNTTIKTMEKAMIEKIQRDIDNINKHNFSVMQSMQEKINLQENQIAQMQEKIGIQQEMLKNPKRFKVK